MNNEELINKIDTFISDYDPYEYQDTEDYPSFNREQIAQEVRCYDLSGVKSYLKEILEEDDDPDVQNEVKEILKDIKKYQNKEKEGR